MVGPLLPPPFLPQLASCPHRCPPPSGPASMAAFGRSAATIDQKHGPAQTFGRRGRETQNAINPSKPRPAHKARPVFCGAYLKTLISYTRVSRALPTNCARRRTGKASQPARKPRTLPAPPARKSYTSRAKAARKPTRGFIGQRCHEPRVRRPGIDVYINTLLRSWPASKHAG